MAREEKLLCRPSREIERCGAFRTARSLEKSLRGFLTPACTREGFCELDHELVRIRAATRIDADAARRLDTMLLKLERSLNDPERYERASAAATIEIAAIGGSPPLAEMIESFAHRIGRYARMGLASASRRKTSIGQWRSLVEALQAGDADRAAAVHCRLALDNRDEAVKVLRRRTTSSHFST